MSKFWLILLPFMFGCNKSKQQVYMGEKAKYENNAYNDVDNWDYVIKFNYSGHDYIKFGRGSGQWGVHDPDCGCAKQD